MYSYCIQQLTFVIRASQVLVNSFDIVHQLIPDHPRQVCSSRRNRVMSMHAAQKLLPIASMRPE